MLVYQRVLDIVVSLHVSKSMWRTLPKKVTCLSSNLHPLRIIFHWLVVLTILKNMISSAGMMTFPTEWKVIKVMFQTTNQFINANGQRISMARWRTIPRISPLHVDCWSNVSRLWIARGDAWRLVIKNLVKERHHIWRKLGEIDLCFPFLWLVIHSCQVLSASTKIDAGISKTNSRTFKHHGHLKFLKELSHVLLCFPSPWVMILPNTFDSKISELINNQPIIYQIHRHCHCNSWVKHLNAKENNIKKKNSTRW